MLVPLKQNNKKWIYVIRDEGTIVVKLEIDK